MQYQVSRNGQTYGPYTLDDLQRYLASGNVLPTDLAKSAEMTDWLPVSAIVSQQGAAVPPPQQPGFGGQSYANPVAPIQNYGGQPAYNPYAPNPALAASPYPDPPNLHWALVLLFGCFCSLFLFVWMFVQAAWMRKVQPTSQAIYYYAGAVGCLILGGGFLASRGTAPFSGIFWLAYIVLLIVGHFNLRTSLLQHFNGPEPIGLQLSGVMTFFFSPFYFQYHFTRINQMKQAARYSQGRAF